MNIAKLLKIPLLIDVAEMTSLLECYPHTLYAVQRLVPKGETTLSKESFLSIYQSYIEALKSGENPKQLIAPALSVDESALEVRSFDQRELVKPILPIVQMQPHNIDEKFRSMIYGTDSISWGVQLTYPQLFHDPRTHQVEKVDGRFFNTELFQSIRKWVRHNTLPTPFLVDGKKVNVPIRLGKQCFDWIANHPGLKRKEIGIVC